MQAKKITKQQEMQQLLEQLMRACPYPYNSKEYWIYNAGLMGTMLARYAATDMIIRNEIQARIKQAAD